MSDATHEAPERIWIWGWRTDSVWQEQTWQHEDEPMSTMEYVRFDLMETAEQRGYANAMEAERKLHEDRIEALEAKLAKAVEALKALIQQTHDCEKELTEDLHHRDFCGESEPLTKARATLAEISSEAALNKGESHE